MVHGGATAFHGRQQECIRSRDQMKGEALAEGGDKSSPTLLAQDVCRATRRPCDRSQEPHGRLSGKRRDWTASETSGEDSVATTLLPLANHAGATPVRALPEVDSVVHVTRW